MFGSKKDQDKNPKKQKSIEIELETMKDFLIGKKQKRRMRITDNGFEEELIKKKEEEGLEKKANEKKQKKERSLKSPFLTDEVSELPIFKKEVFQDPIISKEEDLKGEPEKKIKKESLEEVPFLKESSLSDGFNKKEGNKKKLKERESRFESQTDLNKITNIKNKNSSGSFNKPLLIIALVVFFSAVLAGGYYYFYIIREEKNNDQFVSIPDLPENVDLVREEDVDAEEGQGVEVKPEKEDLIGEMQVPVELVDASEGSFSNPFIFNFDNNSSSEDFIEQLSDFLIDLKQLINPEVLTEGVFVKIEEGSFDSEEPSLDDLGEKKIFPWKKGEDLLLGFGVTIPGIEEFLDGESYVFALEEKVLVDNELEEEIRISLFMNIDQAVHGLALENFIKSNESNLPVHFSNLFIYGKKPEVLGEVSFSQSDLEPRGRYFNYVSGETGKSIDWVVIEQDGKRFLMISTSMHSTKGIVERLIK